MDFFAKHQNELNRIQTECENMLRKEVVPFWEEKVPDWEYGGFFQYFDRQGRRYRDSKEGWFQGRDLYMFSALYQEIENNDTWYRIAENGYGFLRGKLYAGDGRFYKETDRKGNPVKGTESIFTDFFAVEGIARFLKIKKDLDEQELDVLKNLVEKLLYHIGLPEVMEEEHVPDGYEKHAVNFMTILALLECRGIFGTAYDEILDSCIRKSLYSFASDRYKAGSEYIPISQCEKRTGPGCIMDPGHTMESVWFSMEGAAALGKKEYLDRAGTVLDWVIDKCWDKDYGGFFLTTNLEGEKPEEPYDKEMYGGKEVLWQDKVWWVQAEGLLALGFSSVHTQNERHFEYFLKQYDYIKNNFRDQTYGEWFPLLTRDGRKIMTDKGFEQKGPYHVPRCLMKLSKLLK